MADETQCQDRKVFNRKHKHIYTCILIISNSPFWNVLPLPFTAEKWKNDKSNSSDFEKNINLCVFIIQVTQQKKHGKQPVKMKIQTLS